jgi:hypothetical protein
MLHYERNEEIRTELEMYAIQDNITEYRIRWCAHCPNKLFYTNQGKEEMWSVLGTDGQLMSKQETLLYPEVMMMMLYYT